MPFIKEVRMKPATGGFIITYDYLAKADESNDFSSVRFVSSPDEVFTDGLEALKRIGELANAKNNLDFFTEDGKRKVGTIAGKDMTEEEPGPEVTA